MLWGLSTNAWRRCASVFHKEKKFFFLYRNADVRPWSSCITHICASTYTSLYTHMQVCLHAASWPPFEVVSWEYCFPTVSPAVVRRSLIYTRLQQQLQPPYTRKGNFRWEFWWSWVFTVRLMSCVCLRSLLDLTVITWPFISVSICAYMCALGYI